MLENTTSFDVRTLLHASYVAFVFGVLMFGALAFRQVIDNLEVKRLALGEDRESFVDATAGLIVGLCWSAVIVGAYAMYAFGPASVYAYAAPLIAGVQALQVTMRLYFQRTLLRTRGLIVRRVWLDRLRAIPFTDIVMIRLQRGRVWTEVRIGLPREEIVFRIFSFNLPALERALQASSTAPILWLSSRRESASTRTIV